MTMPETIYVCEECGTTNVVHKYQAYPCGDILNLCVECFSYTITCAICDEFVQELNKLTTLDLD